MALRKLFVFSGTKPVSRRKLLRPTHPLPNSVMIKARQGGAGRPMRPWNGKGSPSSHRLFLSALCIQVLLWLFSAAWKHEIGDLAN